MTGNRRQNGVRTVEIKDAATGQTTAAIQINQTISKWKATCGLGITVLTLLGLVAGAARLGVQYEVTDAIRDEARPPDGAIYETATRCAHEHMDQLEEDFDEKLGPILSAIQDDSRKVAALEATQQSLKEQLERQHDDTMGLLHRIANGE